jgi:hypothetical protein
VIAVGISPAGTELHRIVSSKPGAEKTNVSAIGSVPMFFPLIQVLAGMNTSPPAWRSRSSSPSEHVGRSALDQQDFILKQVSVLG